MSCYFCEHALGPDWDWVIVLDEDGLPVACCWRCWEMAE